MSAALGAHTELHQLVAAAIGGDAVAGTGFGFVGVMAAAAPAIRQDIAPAFEMYTLLSHYLDRLPIVHTELGSSAVPLAPAVHYDPGAGRLLALLPVGKGELSLVAHWLASGLRSDTVRDMPGLLALPFSVETRGGTRHLLPEWLAAYYVDGHAEHCVPLLALPSMTLDARLADWLAIAFERMPLFGMPCAAARAAMAAAAPT